MEWERVEWSGKEWEEIELSGRKMNEKKILQKNIFIFGKILVKKSFPEKICKKIFY